MNEGLGSSETIRDDGCGTSSFTITWEEIGYGAWLSYENSWIWEIWEAIRASSSSRSFDSGANYSITGAWF